VRRAANTTAPDVGGGGRGRGAEQGDGFGPLPGVVSADLVEETDDPCGGSDSADEKAQYWV